MNCYYYQTDIGRIGIAAEKEIITNLFFETDSVPKGAELRETAALTEASLQLKAYLAGNLQEFSLSLQPEGTAFMQSVWKILCSIPYGKTASYKEVAVAAGNPQAGRAVGMASNRNPIPIFIPCHRVIGTNGKLVGYRGGLDLKAKLLEFEKQHDPA